MHDRIQGVIMRRFFILLQELLYSKWQIHSWNIYPGLGEAAIIEEALGGKNIYREMLIIPLLPASPRRYLTAGGQSANASDVSDLVPTHWSRVSHIYHVIPLAHRLLYTSASRVAYEYVDCGIRYNSYVSA